MKVWKFGRVLSEFERVWDKWSWKPLKFKSLKVCSTEFQARLKQTFLSNNFKNLQDTISGEILGAMQT